MLVINELKDDSTVRSYKILTRHICCTLWVGGWVYHSQSRDNLRRRKRYGAGDKFLSAQISSTEALRIANSDIQTLRPLRIPMQYHLFFLGKHRARIESHISIKKTFSPLKKKMGGESLSWFFWPGRLLRASLFAGHITKHMTGLSLPWRGLCGPQIFVFYSELPEGFKSG